MNEKDYSSLKQELDNYINTNVTLSSFGISKEDFVADAKEQLMQNVKQKATEWLSQQENAVIDDNM